MTQKPKYRHLLDADAVTKLGQLEIIATRIVEGFISGKHRSPYRGSSVEFAEHRPYSPGDEIRLIDWRSYARTDRYYIKQFEQDTNLQAHLVIDSSGSMGFGMSTTTKLHYAQMMAACLARLMLHQQDAVGMAIIDTRVRTYIPPRSKPSHLSVLLDELSRTSPGGETALAAMLHELAKRLKRRGLIILCSDCFDDVGALVNALHHLRSRGHETLLFHVMAPEELSFSFSKWTQFECLEVPGLRRNLDPALIRKRYLERVKAFLGQLKDGCAEVNCDYSPLSTDQPLGDSLAYYLGRRAMRMKTR